VAYDNTIRVPGRSGGPGNPVINHREVQTKRGFEWVTEDEVIKAVGIWANVAGPRG
jgi:hypothetical protein